MKRRRKWFSYTLKLEGLSELRFISIDDGVGARDKWKRGYLPFERSSYFAIAFAKLLDLPKASCIPSPSFFFDIEKNYKGPQSYCLLNSSFLHIWLAIYNWPSGSLEHTCSKPEYLTVTQIARWSPIRPCWRCYGWNNIGSACRGNVRKGQDIRKTRIRRHKSTEIYLCN